MADSISFHSLQQPQGSHAHSIKLFSELQFVTESMDEKGGINHRHLKMEELYELQITATKCVQINLQSIAKIDQEMRSFFLSADYVDGSCNYMTCVSALNPIFALS